MHGQRWKRIGGAFHNCGVSFNQVEHVHVASCVVMHRDTKPVTARLNKFERMQAGAFFAPAFSRGYGHLLVDKMFAHPLGGAVPLDVLEAMLQIDRTRAAIQAQAPPIPQLEGEDVGRCANLQDHAVTARAVDGPGGNKKVIMLAGRPHIHIRLGGESRSTCLRGVQVGGHRLRVDPLAQAQEHGRVRRGVQHVVAFILRVRHPELLVDITRQGMHLQRKIAALHGVEKVKTDGKFRAELVEDVCAQQSLRLFMHQRLGRQLILAGSKAKRQAVLFGHAVEAPRIIFWTIGKIKPAPHPLPAPRAGIEEGHQAEWPPAHRGQSGAQRVSAQHPRLFGHIAVDPEVHLVVNLMPLGVGGAPIQKEPSLVKLPRWRICIRESQAGGLPPALPLLNLPASHIRIDQQVPRGQQQRGPGANGDHPAACILCRAAGLIELGRIEKLLQRDREHAAKHRVVAQPPSKSCFNLRRGQQGFRALQHQFRRQASDQFASQRLQQHTGITFNRNAPRIAVCMQSIENLAPTQSALIFSV